MNFCLNTYVHLIGQKFSGVSKQLSFTPQIFWVKSAKIDFLRKRGFERSCHRIEVQMVANWSSRLEKARNT